MKSTKKHFKKYIKNKKIKQNKMIKMKKIDKKTKWKYGVLAIVFSLAFVAPELFQFVDFGTVEKNQPKSWIDVTYNVSAN